MSNFAARAATAPELVKFRSANQAVKLGLAIQHPAMVYTARVNQTFTTLDGVAQLTYDSALGTLADVLAGMTVYIGSSAGASDKGICRVRKLPTADTLYINQVSDIQFADNDYLTIVNAFGLWQKDITLTGGVIRMDFDIEFGAYTNGGVIPRIAPQVAVLHLAAGVAEFIPPDPTLSACYDDETVVSYLYEAPGAADTYDMDTSAPSWTYEAAGEYRWSCSITDSAGRVSTSYRWIFVDPDPIPFRLEACSGDYGEGGWTFEVKCLADVAKTEVVDRALCVLYATDYYDGVEGSVGKIAGYENIVCIGWIDGESISFDSGSGEVTFSVKSAAHWMNKIRAFPFELQDVSGVPANWKQIKEMTVDKALAHLLYWTSTATSVMDCFFTDDITRLKVLAKPVGSLYEQISAIALNTIFATPLVNSYGQLYVEIDSQMIAASERASLPVVMDITELDRGDGLEIIRNTSAKTAMIELSAASDYDGATAAPIYSHAPGVIPKTHGDIASFDDYIIFDQDECNRIAGCLMAVSNNDYEPLDASLAENNRLLDIAPRMYCTLTIDSADNPRGVGLTAARLIPRKVELVQDENSLQTHVTFELEAIGVDGVTYYPPPVVQNNLGDYGIGDVGFDFPNANLGDWFPDTVPNPVPGAGCGSEFNSFGVSWDKSEIRGDDVPPVAKIYFPCRVRPKSYNYASPSKLVIDLHYYGDAAGKVALYGVKSGARVVTAGANFEFDPISPVEVDGFELELQAGLGSPVAYVPMEGISSGSVQAVNDSGVTINGLEVGKYYAVEGLGGPWDNDIVTPINGILYTYSADVDGGEFSGSVGWVTWNGFQSNIFANANPNGCIFSERIGSTHYGRSYFLAGQTSIAYRVADSLFTDNGGSLGYLLRNVRVDGRRVTLGSTSVNNVCPLE